MSPKNSIRVAKVFWHIGKAVFKTADWVGEFWALEWIQKPLDHIGDWCMGVSAKFLMKGYWDLDPDADWDG